jgi:hypothetical protein
LKKVSNRSKSRQVETSLFRCFYITENNNVVSFFFSVGVIWKNSTYIDFSITFTKFLKHFNLPYFNIMSLVIDKNEPKLLGEEIYMNNYLATKYLKVVTNFTTDTTKFKNKKINSEYEKMYF